MNLAERRKMIKEKQNRQLLNWFVHKSLHDKFQKNKKVKKTFGCNFILIIFWCQGSLG